MVRQKVAEAVADDGDSDEADELRYTATELGKLKIKYDNMMKSYGELQTKHRDLEGKFTSVCRDGAASKDKLYTLHDLLDELTSKASALVEEA
jgi:hypothetical protein